MRFNQLLDRPLAQKLWDYNKIKQPLRPADFLFVMCSYDLDVADYTDILSMQKKGDFIFLSGGSKDCQGMRRRDWRKKESHIFKERLVELGSKPESLKIEDTSQTMFEYFKNSKEILKDHDPELKTGLIVTTPNAERRALATGQIEWPEITWQVTSPNVTYENYVDKFDEEALIELLVSDVWKIQNYAKQGYVTPQDMPKEVEDAMNALIKKGYTKHIPKD